MEEYIEGIEKIVESTNKIIRYPEWPRGMESNKDKD